MKVLAIITFSTFCAAAVYAVPEEDSAPSIVASLADSTVSKRPEKRGVGLGYGLSGLGYDSAHLGYNGALAGYHHPAGYVAPVASTTVIKSGYAALPVASAAYPAYDYGKYTGFYPGYTTGYGGYAGVPVATSATGYGKIIQPATTTYSKVIHSYPHYGTAVGAVSPALGYSGVAGYHGGYVY
ncbi:shematrin-like protein 2 [Armigeres subalbatus]|uniref:shematrin-like protein 2 n=1 Tax=Armigeres subalbatus TaxID=124917 RepID=UPI002ED0C7BC